MSKYIAIDLDGQGLFAVGGTARSGLAKVEQALAWVGPEADGGPGVLTAANAKAVGEQLRERLRAAGVPNAPVLVSVPRDRVVLKELRYPAVSPAEEPNLVRFQAVKELSDSPDDVVLDYVPLTHGTVAGERRSMAVVIRKDLYNAVQQMCTAAGVRLLAVTARPYAVAAGLDRAIATSVTTAPDAKTDAVAALTLGPGGGEFTVTRQGEVAFTRTLPPPVVASDAMLLAEVRRNLTMYAGANPGHPVQALYVAEASGRWALRLGAALGVPVHAYDPLAGSAPEIEDPSRGRFAGAAGLLAARATGDLPINFSSPRQPRVEADPGKRQIVLAALVASALLALGGVWGLLSLRAANADIELKTAARDAAKKQAEDMKPEADRLAAAEGWKRRRVVWLDELYDLADRMPVASGYHATSFVGKVLPPDPKTGKQDSQGAIELKVTAKNPEPVNALIDAIARDAADPAPADPKNPPRFYVGWDKTIGGASQSEKDARDYTVFTKVNQRPANKFSRTPLYPSPSRQGYPPAAAKEAPKEKEPEPPPPAEKKDTEKKDAKEPVPDPKVKDVKTEAE